MSRRGQITIFAIAGIIIVAMIGLYLFARNIGIGIDPHDFVRTKEAPIRTEVEECILQGAEISLVQMGKQGGDLNPVLYERFKGERVTFLCYDQEKEFTCINRMLTKEDMQNELNTFFKEQLYQCIDLTGFATLGVDINVGELIVNTTINKENVFVNVNYPVTIRKGESELVISDFNKEIKSHLGELYNVAMDIVDSESKLGRFDALSYSLMHESKYIIRPYKPYPDKVYVMNIKDNPYIFQFAIQGEGRVSTGTDLSIEEGIANE